MGRPKGEIKKQTSLRLNKFRYGLAYDKYGQDLTGKLESKINEYLLDLIAE
jgi:hypothetical protein